ncbi:hypothetical protein VPHK251G3_0033 [Vibrio phage K251 g3]
MKSGIASCCMFLVVVLVIATVGYAVSTSVNTYLAELGNAFNAIK